MLRQKDWLLAPDNVTVFGYDAGGRLATLAHDGGTTPWNQLTYDLNDWITQLRLHHAAPTPHDDPAVNYAYNRAGRLVTANRVGNRLDEGYRYDATGNRLNPGYGTGNHNRLLNDERTTSARTTMQLGESSAASIRSATCLASSAIGSATTCVGSSRIRTKRYTVTAGEAGRAVGNARTKKAGEERRVPKRG